MTSRAWRDQSTGEEHPPHRSRGKSTTPAPQPQGEKPPTHYQRPSYQEEPARGGRLELRMPGMHRPLVVNVPASDDPVRVHCSLCGAEWTGKWMPTGAPHYTQGCWTISTMAQSLAPDLGSHHRKQAPRMAGERWRWRRHKVAVRCLCQAGRQNAPGLSPPSPRALAIKRRHMRWVALAVERMHRGEPVLPGGPDPLLELR